MNAMPPVIELTGITKHFSTEEVDTYALRGIDLEVRKGEFVAVTGPSGCGKSTLMAVLGLLTAFQQGRYRLAGRDVGTLNGDARATVRNQHIGFVFQSFNLIGDLTVLENVALPLKFRGGVSRSQREERARGALERVGLTQRLKHYPHQLSGGQQQRVAIARALVGEPDLILADEPTGNLDSENAATVMRLFEELHAAGATLLMVTHEGALAQRAQRAVRMLDGRVVDTVMAAA
ncbi:MAG: ABC transporter ATP-binding protein [Xanthomonadaceae bacterium]|nr:ABC transporter ATP-binding protein [Xanthomonadaceae bacterium]MDE2245493.1 ABC transporter ATP-binding protein [Xanthomonadaceae bacterium]